MSLVHAIVSLLTDTLDTLRLWVSLYHSWVYGILFLVLFCETGLVFTPFLPGDSLLFAAGTLAGAELFDVRVLLVVVLFAVILGDNTNYLIGRFLGRKIMDSRHGGRLVKPEYVLRTQAFFEKHGGKTISLARFFPIIRTYAPFMAGLGQMHWPRFFGFSLLGTTAWVTLCVGAGWFLGGLPLVRDNFELIVIMIVLVSLSPMLYHALKAKLQRRGTLTENTSTEDTPPQ
ncbi:MAG: VTT domain-containing protein [Coriobacteriia bacterium]